jgi:hypothetical protein
MSASGRCKHKSVPADAVLYARVKAAAKRKFPTYPSIYANSWLVQEYKRRGGKYKCSLESQRGGLRRWYKEKWVDLSRPLAGGGYAQCGRSHVDTAEWRKAYPKCRPLSEVKKMTSSQIRSAVRRKRAAVRSSKRGTPVYVSTLTEHKPKRRRRSGRAKANPKGMPVLAMLLVGGVLGWLALRKYQTSSA